MKHFFIFILSVCLSAQGNAQLFTEHFDSLSSVLVNGWTRVNNSSPAGSAGWAQGTQATGTSAYAGSATAYFETSYLAVNNSGTISDWLISPAVTVNNGDSISFYAVSYNSHTYPDRLECRMSPAGGTSVGASATSVGDFTVNIFTINQQLDTSSFPSVVGGGSWERFSGQITGLSGPTSVRFALRYFVTNAGASAVNASVIGVDELNVFQPAGINESEKITLRLFPNPAHDQLQLVTDKTSDYRYSVFDLTGRHCFSGNFSGNTGFISLGELQPGIYLLDLINESGERSRIRFQKLN